MAEGRKRNCKLEGRLGRLKYIYVTLISIQPWAVVLVLRKGNVYPANSVGKFEFNSLLALGKNDFR